MYMMDSPSSVARSLSMGIALGVALVSGCTRCDVPVRHVDRVLFVLHRDKPDAGRGEYVKGVHEG